MKQCNKVMDAFLAANNNETLTNDDQMDVKYNLKWHLS